MRALVLAALLAAALAGPALAAGPKFTCSPAPVDCSGWRDHDVTLRWFPSPEAVDSDNCPTSKLLTAEGATTWVCRELIGSAWVAEAATVRIDKTAPRLGEPSADRAPDANGWYRSEVHVRFTGNDAKGGIAVSGLAADGCTSFTYVGPDTAGRSFSGTCRDRAGNVSPSRTFALRFDSTPPTVARIAPTRPPDHAGWYTEPVAFAVTGSDATSGVAGCDPLAYAGPDSAAAVVVGTCRDRAGNAASGSFAVPFDATAPALAAAEASSADGVVRLTWAAAGAAAVEVVRSPGRAGADRTVIHRGGGTRLVDRSVRNGRRYEYRLTAVDEAGNSAARTLAVTPGPRLLAPAARARVATPPLLRWTKVRGARYYNVQLFRSGRKVLSAWPSKPRLQLERRWRYRGKRRLRPGRYRWLVWPGEGRRARNEYGPRIGERTFTIAPNP